MFFHRPHFKRACQHIGLLRHRPFPQLQKVPLGGTAPRGAKVGVMAIASLRVRWEAERWKFKPGTVSVLFPPTNTFDHNRHINVIFFEFQSLTGEYPKY